jgi:hypothetical protein
VIDRAVVFSDHRMTGNRMTGMTGNRMTGNPKAKTWGRLSPVGFGEI